MVRQRVFNRPGYRPDIDALRGISVLLVLIYHAFPSLIPGGFIGVDVFFVISGFLITRVIVNQLELETFSIRDFYAQRCRRILPALITVLIFAMIAGWMVLYPSEYKQLGIHISGSALFIVNFVFINELGYFDTDSHFKPLLHLWTLSVEEQFYVLWPIILILLYKLRLSFKLTIIGLVAISFFSNLYFISEYPNSVFFHSLTRFWELGIGGLLAVYMPTDEHLEQHNELRSRLIFFAGLALILGAAIHLNSSQKFPGALALFPTLGAVLIIFAKWNPTHWIGLTKIGLISYPLYLWHWVLISFTTIYLGKPPSFGVMFVLIMLSFIMATLTYYYIEALRYSKNKAIPLLLVGILLNLSVIGYQISAHSGFAQRPHLDTLVAHSEDLKRTPEVDDECLSRIWKQLNSQPIFEYCRATINDQFNETIVLLGDSHAHAAFPGLMETAAKHSYNTVLLASSSCPPLLRFLWGPTETKISKCQQSIEQRLQIIAKDLTVRKVILINRGPVYYHGEVKGKHTENSVRKSLDNLVSEKETLTTYLTGLKRTLDQLEQNEHVSQIGILTENPELDFHPKNTFPRPFDIFGWSIGNHKVLRSLYELRMDALKRGSHGHIANMQKTQIIEVGDFFCDQLFCTVFKGGKFLYADDDHLSVSGSRFLAHQIEPILFE